MPLLPDSTFLIDLRQEFQTGRPGPLVRLHRRHALASYRISVVAVAEFLRGDPARDAILFVQQNFGRLEPVTREVALRWAELQRTRDRTGKPLGANDAWLAATALLGGHTILTRDKDYGGVPGLRVIRYARPRA